MDQVAKSKTVSFRIPSDLEDALRAEASDKHLTLNAFVISSLRASLESVKLCKQFPLILITGKTLAALVQPLDEEMLRTIAKECIVPQIKEICRVMFGGADFNGLIAVSNFFLKSGFSWFTSVARVKVNRNERFTARHGLGAKFSFLVGEVVKQCLESVSLQVTYESTENFVILDIDSSHEVREVASDRSNSSNSK
jgi:hypothetical protein